MIKLDHVQFSYTKESPALTDITVSIEPGIHLLAGENGAGKTTLLRLMAGLITPQKGICLINDNNPLSDQPSQRGKSFLLEENIFFPHKTIRKFARLHSTYYPNFSQELFEANLKQFGLTGNEPMKSLSLGNRKKTQLSYVLALGTDLLLLDEPTNGLDIQSKMTLRKVIAGSLADNQTLIVATHTVSELENMYDGAVFISASRLLCTATADELSSRLSFISSALPLPEALYSEMDAGRYLNIVADNANETKTDWRLLYCALNSPQRNTILEYLNPLTPNSES